MTSTNASEEARARKVYDEALLAEATESGPHTPGFARRAAVRAMLAFAKPSPDTVSEEVEGIDYRRLLWLYINHVGQEEGTTFIPQPYDDQFTDAQRAELERLDEMREYTSPDALEGRRRDRACDP